MSRTDAQRIFGALAVALVFAACRQDMHDQPKLEALEASPVFANGAASRDLVEGTVARGDLEEDEHLYTGMVKGTPVTTFPFPVTDSVMQRGQTRFNIYCAPCHGRAGDAKGMATPYGDWSVPSLLSEDYRGYDVGTLFDVITNGSGDMKPYGDQIHPRDRWAIVAYLRALQLSQNADVATLPQQDKDALTRVP